MRSPLVLRASLVLALATAALAASAQTYHLTILDTLISHDTYSQGRAVNDSGQVAGYAFTASGDAYAFLSMPGGTVKDLGVPAGYTGSAGIGVNDSGQVAGFLRISSNDRAFLSAPNGGALKILGLPSGYSSTDGEAVNASGQVVGLASIVTGSSHYSHAFLSGPNGGSLKDLGTLGGVNSVAYGVNDLGQATGSADTATGGTHAFLSVANGGSLKDLGTLVGYGYGSQGNAVNASGQVAGFSESVNSSHAFLSAPNGGALTDLGTLGGRDSQAYGVNDAGQVVGYSYTSQAEVGLGDAFLYTATGGMVDLNSLLDASGAGLRLTDAYAISDTGFITGEGQIDGSGDSFAFLLTLNPTPEPAPLAALGVGALAVLRRRRR